MTENREQLAKAYHRPQWEIDPAEIGQCHLMDFFAEEVFLLDGVASVLGDIAMLSDEPGEYPKVTTLAIDSVFGFRQSIERATWSLREKVDALHNQMRLLGTVVYTGQAGTTPAQGDGHLEAGRARAGTRVPVATTPIRPSTREKDPSITGAHPDDEVEDNERDLRMLDQALAGLQAIAEHSAIEPEDFEPARFLIQKLSDRIEGIAEGTLKDAGRVVGPGREKVNDDSRGAKTKPGRNSSRPGSNGNARRPAMAQA